MVSLGETMLYFQGEHYGLLRYNNRFDKFVGGTESNTMISLAKIGFSTSWISRLGRDEFGINIRDFIRGHGVDVSRVTFDDQAPTGVFFVEKNANDETRSFYYRQGSAATKMAYDDLDLDFIHSHRVLHLTGITPIMSPCCLDLVSNLIKEAKRRNMVITLDPNLRLTMADIGEFKQALLPLLPDIDILLPSEAELTRLMGRPRLEEAVEAAFDMGLSCLVVKRGDRGSLIRRPGVEIREPAVKVKKVISSMAAGDAFNAGYIAALLKGLDDTEALKLANLLGAMATLAWGPYESIPDWEQISSYLSGRGIIER